MPDDSKLGQTQLRVRYAETDQMGRAYYGVYFQWFEIGRTDLLRDLGAPYAELERTGHLMPVVEANAKYLAPANYDSELIIKTEVEFVKQVRICFISKIYDKASSTLLTIGRVVLACMGKDHKPKRIPAWLKERIEEHQKTNAHKGGAKL